MDTRVIPYSELQAARRGRRLRNRTDDPLREVAAARGRNGKGRVRRFNCGTATLSFREGGLIPDTFVLTIHDREEETQVSWKANRGLFLRTNRPLSPPSEKYCELRHVAAKFERLSDGLDPWVTATIQHVLLHHPGPYAGLPAAATTAAQVRCA